MYTHVHRSIPLMNFTARQTYHGPKCIAATSCEADDDIISQAAGLSCGRDVPSSARWLLTLTWLERPGGTTMATHGHEHLFCKDLTKKIPFDHPGRPGGTFACSLSFCSRRSTRSRGLVAQRALICRKNILQLTGPPQNILPASKTWLPKKAILAGRCLHVFPSNLEKPGTGSTCVHPYTACISPVWTTTVWTTTGLADCLATW